MYANGGAEEDAFDGFGDLDSFFVLKRKNGDAEYAIEDFVDLADYSIRAGSGSKVRSIEQEDGERPSSSVIDFLTEVLERVSARVSMLTAVVEVYHIDPTYRDLYYAHYSKKLFNVGRFSIRVSLFEDELDADGFTKKTEREISDLAIGSVVLCPINRGVIGRTIIRPEFIASGSEEIDVRLSTFNLTIRGKRVCIPGFVYRQQDGEVMSCAEVSLLNLVCYYSNEYNEYAVATPSEILALEEPLASERLTPTRGLDFYDMSRIMSGLRFFPRVYNTEDMRLVRLPNGPEVGEADWMNRILSWYVSSGIPVAVYVSPDSSLRSGHSLLCIGRESWSEERRKTIGTALAGELESTDAGLSRALRLSRRAWEGATSDSGDVKWDSESGRIVGRRSCVLLDAADLDEQYVVVDDAQIPYAVKPFDRLGPSGWTVPRTYMVPLHRSMVLDSYQAHANGMAVLLHQKAGVLNWAEDFLEDGERVVVRMFMCSSKGYKRARVADHPVLAPIYEELVLPHFVWVLELYRAESYVAVGERHRAFAEVVLDTTSSGVDNPMSKVVFMRYPRKMYVCYPDGEEEMVTIHERLSEDARLIVPYARNLEHVVVRGAESCVGVSRTVG